MLTRLLQRNGIEPWQRGYLLAAAVFGALLGAAALVVTPMVVILCLVGVAGFLMVLKRPEMLLLVFLFVASTIFADKQNPGLGLGFGTIYLTDILVIVAFGIIVVRWLVEPDFTLVRTPLDGPLIVFLALVFATTAARLISRDLRLNDVLGELRIVGHYGLFLVTTNVIRERRQLNILLVGILALSIFVVAAMALQFAAGSSLQILPGRVEQLDNEGRRFSDVTRILAPGQSLVLTSCLILASLLTFDPRRTLLWLGLWASVCFGLVLTFNRNFWIGAVLSIGILILCVYSEERKRILRRVGLVAAFGCLLLAIFVIKPNQHVSDLALASADRIFSLTEPSTFTSQDSSFRWRDFEYRYASKVIEANPLTGIGMGSRYRPWVPPYDYEQYDGRTYLHNGHLWLILKAGLPAYLSFMAFSSLVIVRCFLYWRSISQPWMRAIVWGTALVFISVLIGSIVNSMLMQWYWTGLLGILAGMAEVVIQQHTSPRHSEGLSNRLQDDNAGG
jgi:hypothetical protein